MFIVIILLLLLMCLFTFIAIIYLCCVDFIYLFIIVYIQCLFIVFLSITVYSRNCVEYVRYYLNVNPTIEWVLWGIEISLRRLIDQHGPTGKKSSGIFKAQSPQRFLNRKSLFDA